MHMAHTDGTQEVTKEILHGNVLRVSREQERGPGNRQDEDTRYTCRNCQRTNQKYPYPPPPFLILSTRPQPSVPSRTAVRERQCLYFHLSLDHTSPQVPAAVAFSPLITWSGCVQRGVMGFVQSLS